MTAYDTNTQPTQYDSTTHSSKVLDTFGGRWSAENDSFDGHYNSVAYSTTREHFSKEGFLHGHLQHSIPLRGGSFYWSSESDGYREFENQQQRQYGSPLWTTTSSWTLNEDRNRVILGHGLDGFSAIDTCAAPNLHHDEVPPRHETAAMSPALNSPSTAVVCHHRPQVPPNSASPMLRCRAHQPVPPEQRSKYSELSLNLEFMDRLKQEEQASSRRRQSCHSLSTVAAASPLPLSSPKKRRRSQELFPPSADIERHKHRADHLSASATYLGMSISDDPPDPAHDLWIPTQLTFVDSPNTPSTPTASSSSSSQAESSVTRNVKEPKKPSLACTFCRERKIACGRPPEGSPDPTCNQCARRSFKCEYLNEQQRAKSSKHSRRRRR